MLYLLLAVIGLCALAVFLTRWQWLLWGLLTYLPFAGALVLWTNQDPVFLLAKDFLFVAPLYVAVFLLRPQLLHDLPIPPWLTLSLIFLALVVLLQTMNPGVVNLGMALIGLKVWLFYIPLAYATVAAVRTPQDLVRLLRVMVAVAPLPCIFGLTQWGLSEAYGYQDVMRDFYGEAAQAATQNFTQFELGGVIRRLPSTFSSAPAYYVYTLVILAAGLALQALDPSRGWRSFARVVVVLALCAGMLSGMRAAFVLSPILLAIYGLIAVRGGGAVVGFAMLLLLSGGFLYVAGFDTDQLYEGIAEHTERYQEYGFTWVQFSYALENSPLGSGTGTNTVSARYATEGLSQPELQSIGYWEVQFAKTVHELGIFGLVPFLIVVCGLAGRALFGTFRLRDPRLRRAHAALGAFVLIVFIYFFKAWIIDVDPANVVFWVFVGLLYRLGQWDRALAPAARPQPAFGLGGRRPLQLGPRQPALPQ